MRHSLAAEEKIYVYMNIYIYVCIYTHTHTHTFVHIWWPYVNTEYILAHTAACAIVPGLRGQTENEDEIEDDKHEDDDNDTSKNEAEDQESFLHLVIDDDQNQKR